MYNSSAIYGKSSLGYDNKLTKSVDLSEVFGKNSGIVVNPIANARFSSMPKKYYNVENALPRISKENINFSSVTALPQHMRKKKDKIVQEDLEEKINKEIHDHNFVLNKPDIKKLTHVSDFNQNKIEDNKKQYMNWMNVLSLFHYMKRNKDTTEVKSKNDEFRRNLMTMMFQKNQMLESLAQNISGKDQVTGEDQMLMDRLDGQEKKLDNRQNNVQHKSQAQDSKKMNFMLDMMMQNMMTMQNMMMNMSSMQKETLKFIKGKQNQQQTPDVQYDPLIHNGMGANSMMANKMRNLPKNLSQNFSKQNSIQKDKQQKQRPTYEGYESRSELTKSEDFSSKISKTKSLTQSISKHSSGSRNVTKLKPLPKQATQNIKIVCKKFDYFLYFFLQLLRIIFQITFLKNETFKIFA